jgi:hypothetical protein
MRRRFTKRIHKKKHVFFKKRKGTRKYKKPRYSKNFRFRGGGENENEDRRCTYKGDNAEDIINCKTLIIAADVTEIPSSCFNGSGSGSGPTNLKNKNIERVIIKGNNLTTIGDNAFIACNNLKEIQFPDSLRSIENHAFNSCGFEEIKLPNNITNIGVMAFAHCKNLETVKIPSSITVISYGLFSNCKKLQNITIPDSITSIEDTAFSQCESFTEIIIPESVKTIGRGAFAYCINVRRIVIPNSDISIENDSFLNVGIEYKNMRPGCRVEVYAPPRFSNLFTGIFFMGNLENPLYVFININDYSPNTTDNIICK